MKINCIPADSQDEASVTECSKCKGEIYRDQITFDRQGEQLCPECFEAYIENLYKTSPWLVADLFGYEIVRHV